MTSSAPSADDLTRALSAVEELIAGPETTSGPRRPPAPPNGDAPLQSGCGRVVHPSPGR